MTSSRQIALLSLLFVLPFVSKAYKPAPKGLLRTDDVRNHVWLDARYAVEEDLAQFNAGGLIVTKSHFEKLDEVERSRFILAVEFSEDLDLAGYDLPTTSTLTSIRDKSLVKQFAREYLTLCKNQGIDYLVAPEPATSDFVASLMELDPAYLIPGADLHAVDAKTNKKEVRSLLEKDLILLAGKAEWPKLEKNIRKLRKDKFSLSHYQKVSGNAGVPNFSAQLLTSLHHHSAAFFSKEKSVLPLDDKTIAFLAQTSGSPLESELKKYFEVTDVRDISPAKGTTILVDARADGRVLEPFLESYRDQHQVIALVSNESKHLVEADEYIFFPENHPVHDVLIPQMVYGAIAIDGRSEELANELTGITNRIVLAAGKLRYAPAEWEGLNSQKLREIDEIVRELIEKRASPGCQITVIKGSSIVYDRAFGYLTYDSLIQVNNNTLYDVASITKVAGTLLAIMHLYDQGILQLDDSVSTYLPQYRQTNKSHITLKQLLAHQSGLRSYEPLWKRTLKGDFLDPFSYYSEEDEADDVRLYGMPIHPVMMDSIRNWLKNSPLLKDADKYKYSDLGFMMLQQVVEQVAGMSLENYLFNNFYRPLGLHYTAFNPLEKGYEIFEIAPTEFDNAYRKELIWGRVHDRNAAIFGGVAGHAGLFSSAKELSVIMQMITNDGYHGGRQYLKPSTIELFNQRYFAGNRRALGWDKYDNNVENASPHVSSESFGHTGFTGTMVWADPEHDLVYSFVSNRIYPESSNNTLQRHNYRSKIQSIIYKSILDQKF